MEMMLLSLNAPAVQAIPDPKKANEIARLANDFLAEQVLKRPDRFQALAAIPMQDPDLASRELQRCVRELRFKGALVNGFSQITMWTLQFTMTYLSTGLSGASSKSSTYRSICILATRSPAGRKSTKAMIGCSGRPGPSLRKRPSTHCG